jgi:hypothetical protein
MRLLVAAATSLLLFASSSALAADGKRVVVIGGGPSFRDAMGVALSAWDLKIVPVETPPPRPVMPRAASEAKAIAQRWNATGLVWVATDADEPSLWIYDASTDQVVSRAIGTPPPFDAPTAASAALSVKTLLRSSTVAPVEERIGAPSPPPAAPAPPPPSPAPAEAPLPSAPPASPWLRAEIGGAARAIGGDVDSRVTAGASAWLDASRRVGLGLAVQLGPGLGVEAPRFTGRWGEVTLTPSVRAHVPVGRHLELEPRVGVGLHATSIDGVAVRTAKPASTSRFDGSLDAGLAADLVVSPTFHVGLEAAGSLLLRYQRYLVENDSVFELAPLQGYVGLRLVTGLL